MEKLRVLELYSGIGGMHYALTESSVPAEVVAAVDVNTTANEIYKHNFPNTLLLPKTIEGMTLSDFNKLDFDMILMSPPCQPFTRIGLQGDVSDPRTKSFLYILELLPRRSFVVSTECTLNQSVFECRYDGNLSHSSVRNGNGAQGELSGIHAGKATLHHFLLVQNELSKLPRFILLENVKGFETSSARDALIKTLKECGYSFQELMISPTCIGIPNSRLRYFLIAKAPLGSLSFQTTLEILDGFPKTASSDLTGKSTVSDSHCTTLSSNMRDNKDIIYKLETAQDLERKRSQNSEETVRRLQDFLEEEGQGTGMDHYLLPRKTLLRYAMLMDIVNPTCRRSVCFTKGYGHYVEGTGSVLQSCSDVELESVFKSLEVLSEEEKLKQLSRLKLRYFTPREIANLMGFPPHFTFPPNISIKQQYRVLGNSLNVHVVAKLISLLVL